MKTIINEAKQCAKNVPRQNESRIDVTQHRVVKGNNLYDVMQNRECESRAHPVFNPLSSGGYVYSGCICPLEFFEAM